MVNGDRKNITDITGSSKSGDPVRSSVDFKRIKKIRFTKHKPLDVEGMIEPLSRHFRKPGGTMSLRPIQVDMIVTACQQAALFAMVGVGEGKTLASALIPVGMDAKRPLLIVPSSLVDKTYREIEEYREHFKIPHIKVLGYGAMSTVKNKDILYDLNPDVIILDECHMLKNRNAARTKRFERFITDTAHPPVRLVAMTGTAATKRIEDFAHILRWVSGSLLNPLPNKIAEVKKWGRAINSENAVKQDRYLDYGYNETTPGVLVELFKAEDDDLSFTEDVTEIARRGVMQTIKNSPMVVMTTLPTCKVPLYITNSNYKTTPSIAQALHKLDKKWEGPNGEEYSDATEKWRIGRQLSLGFYQKWAPPPPDWWKEARRNFNRKVRNAIAKGQADSMLHFVGKYPDDPTYRNYTEVKDDYKYEVETIWVDEGLMAMAVCWAESHNGIVWTEHVAVGERLEGLGLKYFGAGKKAARELADWSGPCALSIQAHGVGRNLQRYNRNLVLSCPPSGGIVEQMIGRTHRPGQEKPVYVDFINHTKPLQESMEAIIKDAKFLEQVTEQPQKILTFQNEQGTVA